MRGGIYLFLALLLLTSVSAHVGYVLEEETFERNLGADFAYLLSALTGETIVLILLSAGLLILLYTLGVRTRFYKKEVTHILATACQYDEFIPWIARLGLGIALIGAGTGHVLISPVLDTSSAVATIEILLGFLLLAGFLLAPTLLATLVLYLFGLGQSFYLLGNLDFAALALILLVIDKTRPGIDDLFGIPFLINLRQWRHYVPTILRFGIGSAMIFLALYEKILNPHTSALVVEQYLLQKVIPVSVELWVLGAGVVEFLVGAAILLGIRTRLSAAVAFLVLSMSFFYFSEAVYSHITLFATLSILFVTGGGRLSMFKSAYCRSAQ